MLIYKIMLSYTIMWNYGNVQLWNVSEITYLYYINDMKLNFKKTKISILFMNNIKKSIKYTNTLCRNSAKNFFKKNFFIKIVHTLRMMSYSYPKDYASEYSGCRKSFLGHFSSELELV